MLQAIRSWLIEQGLAGDEHIDTLLAEAQAWSQRPDDFFALTQCAAVAWAP
jgi:hypothetical protein